MASSKRNKRLTLEDSAAPRLRQQPDRHIRCGQLPMRLLLTACEQSVDAERIPNADDVARGVVIEPESDVEIHLLSRAQTIHSSRIEELARPGMFGVIADIFGTKARPLRYLHLDDKGCFSDAFGGRLQGMEEFRQHATQTPAIV